jgi:hypothetical protein
MKCTWSQDEEGCWSTDCNNCFTLVDGSPEDNGMKFCCYCGKRLEEVPWRAEEEKINVERAPGGQHTLGSLIAELEQMPARSVVADLRVGGSYRGDYCHLYLNRGTGLRPALSLFYECRDTLGKKFQGYKGGDYVMDSETPLWIANYGECGVKLMEVREGGEIATAKDEP